MAKTFRKHFGRFESWHFHSDCPDWPLGEYIEQIDILPEQDLCLKCLQLNANDPGLKGSL
jgi:hypothetical protein